MRATDRPAGSHENRKLFGNDFSANWSPRTGEWGTVTLQFRHTGLAIPIPKSLLDKKFESFDIAKETRQFRSKAIYTSFVVFGIAEALALDLGFLKGRMTTEFVTQIVALYTLNGGNLTLAFNDVDHANVLISGFVSGKKLKVVSELLKSIFDVSNDGFDSEKLSEVNEILGEFGLRLFVNMRTQLPDKTPGSVKFLLEITKKIGRTKANEELKESMD